MSDGEIIATGLAFPEGPVWRSGEVVFTEIVGGAVSRWTAEGGVEPVAATGGGPNGAAAGPDGSIWITQNGGMFDGPRTAPGIQRIDAAADVELVITTVGGVALEEPNDLAFGPDGRLWFTDPRGGSDPPSTTRPGRLFAVDVEDGEGELVAELDAVFPNGIAFLADGTLVWTESASRRVMAFLDGRPEVVIELPERHLPDGMCLDIDGRMYVASTYAHCVTVIEAGVIVDRLVCGDGMVTNCCFGGDDLSELYVTESRRGTLWRFPLERRGLPLPFR